MKKILIFTIVLTLLISPTLSADTLPENKSFGKALMTAGCAIFACSLILTLKDQRTGYGHFYGHEVTYQDLKKQYLIGDAVGVVLFSIGAILYFGDEKNLQVNAKVKKKEIVLHLKFSF